MSDLSADRLLSRNEVETAFGISKRFLEVSACRGDGPPMIKIGRLSRYRVKDVRDWIEANRVAGNVPHVRRTPAR